MHTDGNWSDFNVVAFQRCDEILILTVMPQCVGILETGVG